MAMSRKHYNAVAEVILAEAVNINGRMAIEDEAINKALLNVASDLAHVFALDNANFDRGHFLAACGFE